MSNKPLNKCYKNIHPLIDKMILFVFMLIKTERTRIRTLLHINIDWI